MTIDERLEFLLRSTESLHATAQKLTATAQSHTKQIEEHTKQIEADRDAIHTLANIAALHQARIEGLEGGTAKP
jgi:hypothetical protein